MTIYLSTFDTNDPFDNPLFFMVTVMIAAGALAFLMYAITR